MKKPKGNKGNKPNTGSVPNKSSQKTKGGKKTQPNSSNTNSKGDMLGNSSSQKGKQQEY